MKSRTKLILTAAIGAVAALAGCGNEIDTYLVWKADVPGTREHQVCWEQQDAKEREYAQHQFYPHSPARDQGMIAGINSDSLALVTEARLRKMGRSPENETKVRWPSCGQYLE